MTIAELYTQLSDKGFQDHQTGNLFFPAYMYTYNPDKEYEIDAEILDIKNRLHRPNNYLDVMVIDIFEEFVSYLKNRTFGGETKCSYYFKHEESKAKAVNDALSRDAYDKEFLNYLEDKIKQHLAAADDYEVAYVLSLIHI